MIPFKNQLRKGFSFIEAIIALAIIAGAVSTFLLLQQKVFFRVAYNTFKIQRLPLLQNMLLLPKLKMAKESSSSQNQTHDTKKIEKSFADPETKVVYERLPVSSDSELARFEGLYQERITAEWTEAEHKRIADLYHYGFEMQEKNDEAR